MHTCSTFPKYSPVAKLCSSLKNNHKFIHILWIYSTPITTELMIERNPRGFSTHEAKYSISILVQLGEISGRLTHCVSIIPFHDNNLSIANVFFIFQKRPN